MTEAYASAAVRHWNDARLLEGDGRLPNADHLYGFAAECGLKSALVTVGAPSSNAALPDAYRKHVDKLWKLVLPQNLQKRFPGLVAILKVQGNPFDDWSVDQRYNDGAAVTSRVVDRHRRWATRVLGSVGITGVRQAEGQ